MKLSLKPCRPQWLACKRDCLSPREPTTHGLLPIACTKQHKTHNTQPTAHNPQPTGHKTQDTRHKRQDTGHRTQDTRHRTQDTRHKTQDTRHRTQDTRHKAQDTRHKTQDTRHRTQETRETRHKIRSQAPTLIDRALLAKGRQRKSGHPESNQGPSDFCESLQSDALPTEL